MRDVRLKTTEDHQPSFFLAETVKYLYLLFDDPGGFLSGARDVVFTTEGHPRCRVSRVKNDASRRDGADGADRGAAKAPNRRRLEEKLAPENRAFETGRSTSPRFPRRRPRARRARPRCARVGAATHAPGCRGQRRGPRRAVPRALAGPGARFVFGPVAPRRRLRSDEPDVSEPRLCSYGNAPRGSARRGRGHTRSLECERTRLARRRARRALRARPGFRGRLGRRADRGVGDGVRAEGRFRRRPPPLSASPRSRGRSRRCGGTWRGTGTPYARWRRTRRASVWRESD